MKKFLILFLFSLTANAQLTISQCGSPLGTVTDLDIVGSIGMIIGLSVSSVSPTTAYLDISPDLAYLASQSQIQAGQIQSCNSANGTNQYTCSMLPVLSAYTKGMLVNLTVDVSGGVSPTINIGALGPIAITQVDGISAPLELDLIPGQLYPIWFDGAVFRLFTQSNILAPPTWVRPTCDRAHSGRWYQFQGNANVKDSVSICVKAANNGFFWKYVY